MLPNVHFFLVNVTFLWSPTSLPICPLTPDITEHSYHWLEIFSVNLGVG